MFFVWSYIKVIYIRISFVGVDLVNCYLDWIVFCDLSDGICSDSIFCFFFDVDVVR